MTKSIRSNNDVSNLRYKKIYSESINTLFFDKYDSVKKKAKKNLQLSFFIYIFASAFL